METFRSIDKSDELEIQRIDCTHGTARDHSPIVEIVKRFVAIDTGFNILLVRRSNT